MEEVNNNFAAFSNGSQDGAEGETEEDDSKSVGSRPKYRKFHHYVVVWSVQAKQSNIERDADG